MTAAWRQWRGERRNSSFFLEPLEDRVLFNNVTLTFIGDGFKLTKTDTGFAATVLAGDVIDVVIKTTAVEAFKFDGSLLGYDLAIFSDPEDPGLEFSDWTSGADFTVVDGSLDSLDDDHDVFGTGDVDKLGVIGIFAITAPMQGGDFEVFLDNESVVVTDFGDATIPNGFLQVPTLTIHVLPPVDLTTNFTLNLAQPVIAGESFPFRINLTNPQPFVVSTPAAYSAFISTDNLLSQDDVQVITDFPLSLNFKAGQTLAVGTQLTPPLDLPDGEYFLLGTFQFDRAGVGLANDPEFIASSDTFDFSHAFGNVPGRLKPVTKVAILDRNGVRATLQVAGGTGGFALVDENNNLIIQINEADVAGKGKIKITPQVKGTVLEVDSIQATVDLHSITANLVNVNTITTQRINSLVVGNVRDQHQITIGGTSTDKPITVTLGRVANTILTSGAPIKTLTVTEWIDDDEERDVITAPSLGSLKVKGDKKAALAGNFEADLVLTDATAKKTLGSVSVPGAVRDALWRVAGNTGAVTVGAFRDSQLLVGVKDGVEGVPDGADDFNLFALASFTVKDLAGDLNGYVNSFVAAAGTGTVKLKDVDVTNGEAPLGVVADTLKSYTRKDAANATVQKLSKLLDPVADAETDAGDDFVIRIV